MLPKSKRLTNTRDFKRVYQKGSFFSAEDFSLNWQRNNSATTKVGVVVTKKIANKAVDRNRVKRRLREIVRSHFAEIPAGYNIIVNIKSHAMAADFSQIEEEFITAIKRIGNEKNNHRHN